MVFLCPAAGSIGSIATTTSESVMGAVVYDLIPGWRDSHTGAPTWLISGFPGKYMLLFSVTSLVHSQIFFCSWSAVLLSPSWDEELNCFKHMMLTSQFVLLATLKLPLLGELGLQDRQLDTLAPDWLLSHRPPPNQEGHRGTEAHTPIGLAMQETVCQSQPCGMPAVQTSRAAELSFLFSFSFKVDIRNVRLVRITTR